MIPESATTRPTRSALASAKGDHVGLRVPDLDAALAWYGEKLEFRPVGRTEYAGIRYVLIAPANNEDFRIELIGGPGAVDRPPHSDLMASLGQHGWHHLCLRVESVDEALAELKRRGVDVLGEPMDVADIQSRCGFFQDPWGNVMELLQPIRT